MSVKRYEAELNNETGTYYGLVVQRNGNVVESRKRVSEGHASPDEAARAAYATSPQTVKTPDGIRVLSFEEANGIEDPSAPPASRRGAK